MLDQLLDRLGVRVVVLLDDRIGREALRLLRVTRVVLDDPAGDANHGRARRDLLDDDGVRADTRTVADGEAAEHFRAGAHHYALSQSRMALRAAIERGAAE